jgi:hypothetical protein
VDLLAELDSLMDMGRRAPGSDAERRAALYLERRLAELGRTAEAEPVDAWPGWPLSYAIFAALGVVASVVSPTAPLAGAALALAATLFTFLDAAVLLPTLRRALGRRASQNVVSWGERERPGAIVLVAHCDAGRAGLAVGQRAVERRAALGQLIRRPIGGLELLFWAQLAVLACCLFRLAGLDGTPLTAVQFVPTVALIIAVALLVDIAISGTRGGENDNASGVVVALRLAERFGGNRLEHFAVHVLFTGSQKAGAAGMRAFLKRHRLELPRDSTVFLNVDAVGSGTVRYTRREGPVLAFRSHVQLVDLCDEIAEDDEDANAFGARPIVSRAASDAYAARSAGYPTITITCRGRLDYVPGRVDEVALERAEGFCAELIERLDAQVGADRLSAAGES